MTEQQATDMIQLLSDMKTLQMWQVGISIALVGMLTMISFFIGKGDG